jgi:hypothetical protein
MSFHCIKLLGTVHSITFSFSSLKYLYTVHIILVRSKLEHASIFWNDIIPTDANKQEFIQQKFGALCLSSLPLVQYTYALEQLKLHILKERGNHLNELFLTQVYLGSTFCPSLLETDALGVLAHYF